MKHIKPRNRTGPLPALHSRYPVRFRRGTLNPSARQRCLAGFTLIELLVVIAIISLLVSILLPSLNRAKDLARSVTCKANLHNWHIALMTYANEFDAQIPVGQDNVKMDNMWVYWHLRVWPYVSGGQEYSPPTPEARKKTLLYCPGEQVEPWVIYSSGDYTGAVQEAYTSGYGMNVCASGYYSVSRGDWVYWQVEADDTVSTFTSLNRLGRSLEKFDSEVLLLGDSFNQDLNAISWSIGWGDYRSPPWNLDYRHGGQCNVLSLNGSAVSLDELPDPQHWSHPAN